MEKKTETVIWEPLKLSLLDFGAQELLFVSQLASAKVGGAQKAKLPAPKRLKGPMRLLKKPRISLAEGHSC